MPKIGNMPASCCGARCAPWRRSARVAHRPLPLAPLPFSATGGGRVAPPQNEEARRLCRPLAPSDEGAGFLRSKKTGGENDYPSVCWRRQLPSKGSLYRWYHNLAFSMKKDTLRCLFSVCQKTSFFDRLAEGKEAPKTSNSTPKCMWILERGELRSKSKSLA